MRHEGKPDITSKGRTPKRPMGNRRMRTTGRTILALSYLPLSLCISMTALGGVHWPIISVWVLVFLFYLFSGLWALSMEGCHVAKSTVTDRAWMRFWVDDHQLEEAIEDRLRGGGISFEKCRRWAYDVFYEIPMGLTVGVMSQHIGNGHPWLVVLIEGIDCTNVWLAREVKQGLDGIRIEGAPLVGRLVPSRCPSGADC